MAGNTAANTSVAKFSSTKSLSFASSANRAALLTTFAAWAAMWRAIAEEHADQLEKAVKAAAVWRSQMRSGQFAKTVANNGPVAASPELSTEEVKISQSQECDVAVEEDHAVEMQRALDAAAAWRSRIRTAGSSKIATTQSGGACRSDDSTCNSVDVDAVVAPIASVSAGHGDGLVGALPNSPSHEHQAKSAEQDVELQAALDAASKWRSRFQSNNKARENKAESVLPTQKESSHESSSLCDSSAKKKCISPLAAILMGELPDNEPDNESTTASGDEGTCASSDSSEGAPTCWVQGVFLRDVSRILADGLRSQGPRVRLYAGPWGRSGLCRRNEEVLVYIDVPRARKAGAEFRFIQRGLVLVAGVIPAACCRKMVMIKDGSVLYDRTPLEIESA